MRFRTWVESFVAAAVVTIGTIIVVDFDTTSVLTYIYAEISMLTNFYIFSRSIEST